MNKKIILYLSDLIKDNNRVIVPDFGAFIVKNGSKKLLIFNEFLKYNDGLLAEVYAQKENLSKEEALKQIGAFVASIKSELDQKKETVLDSIGTIKVNELGKLTFIQQLEETPVDKPVEETKPPETPKVEATKEENIIELEEPKKVEKPKPVATQPKETPKPESEKPKTTEPVKPEPAKVVKEETIKPAAQKPVSKPTPQPVSKSYREKKEKPVKSSGNFFVNAANNRILQRVLIIIIISVLFIGAFLIIRNNLNTTNKEKIVLEPVSQQDKTDSENLGEKATTETVNPEVKTTKEAEVTEQIIDDLKKNNATTKPIVKQPVNGNNKYFVIAGCFSNENNADKLANKLQSQGYQASKFGKIGSLHAVCFQSFQSKADATSYLRKIRRETNSNAWLYSKN